MMLGAGFTGGSATAVSAITLLTSGSLLASQATLTNQAIGSPNSRRKIVVCAQGTRNGGAVPSCTVGGLTATVLDNVSTSAGPVFSHNYIWEQEYPEDSTATIVFSLGTQNLFYAVYSVIGGDFQTSSEITSEAGANLTEEISLLANTGFISMWSQTAAQGTPPTVTWTEASENAEGVTSHVFGDGSFGVGRSSIASRRVSSATGTVDLLTTKDVVNFNRTARLTVFYA